MCFTWRVEGSPTEGRGPWRKGGESCPTEWRGGVPDGGAADRGVADKGDAERGVFWLRGPRRQRRGAARGDADRGEDDRGDRNADRGDGDADRVDGMPMEGRTYVLKIIIVTVWVKRSKRLSLSHVQGLPILRKKREQCCLNLRNDHCKSVNL